MRQSRSNSLQDWLRAVVLLVVATPLILLETGRWLALAHMLVMYALAGLFVWQVVELVKEIAR